MKNRYLLPAFAAVLSIATACQDEAKTETASAASAKNLHCDAMSGMCFEVDARGSSCATHTWAGHAKRGECPVGVSGQYGAWALRNDTAATAELCRYEWESDVDAAPDAHALAALGDSDAIDDFAPDCEVVAASAEIVDVTWPELERAFFAQTERLDKLPAGVAPAAPVRVEIIDSAVTRRDGDGEPSHGRLDHGRAMGLIVRKLACPTPESCRAEVASTLALPLVDGPAGTVRDYENGGYFGSLIDLATAIEGAVEDWRNKAPEHRLVINLSVGWEPEHGGDYVDGPDELPGPVRAVWEAIAAARCRGAAVVAAAGNRKTGPYAGTGALYPAAWMTHAAPSVEMCGQLGVKEVADGFSPHMPLVFAAGGVESNDADLGLARANSRPLLVAPAAHAVVADGEAHSMLQTGTSVAAAVTSAAMAVVWSYRPELSAQDVFEIVYDGGADVGRPADVCFGGEPCEGQAHRVSVCGALREACAGGEGGCPVTAPACTQRPGGRVERPVIESIEASKNVSAAELAPAGAIGWPCFGQLYANPSVTVANPCPASQFAAEPGLGAVGPQPTNDPICPHCVLNVVKDQLFVGISSEATGLFTSPVLKVIVDSEVGDVRYFALDAELPEMSPGDEALVHDIDIEAPTFESATIEFVVDGTGGVISPVMPL